MQQWFLYRGQLLQLQRPQPHQNLQHQNVDNHDEGSVGWPHSDWAFISCPKGAEAETRHQERDPFGWYLSYQWCGRMAGRTGNIITNI